MPTSRVIPKRVPVCPNRDSRFTIRRNGGVWWVYYDPPGGTRVAADGPHEDLVKLVNELKAGEGNEPGGAFSISEHFQVIARTKAPSGYKQKALHIVGVSAGFVKRYTQTITFGKGALDPTAKPSEGSDWPGPRCGTTYSFAAPGNPKPPSLNFDEVWTEIEGKIDLLSKHTKSTTYPPTTGPLGAFLAALRRQLPEGGRFRVNEHGRAFTSEGNVYVGTVPLGVWFPPLLPTA